MEALALYRLTKVILEYTTYLISRLTNYNIAKIDIVL